MRKILMVMILFVLSWTAPLFAQLSTIHNTSPSVTQSLDKAINSSQITNPIRQGAHFVVESPDGNHHLNVMNTWEIDEFTQAQTQTLDLVRNIINILLSFTALVVLVLLIIEGYKIVTSGTDSEQFETALKKLKNYAIAIAWIALSRFLISFIFYVLKSCIEGVGVCAL